ncbi:hypothetical protein, partial [Bilophila sp.]|uniref:hypothetical protein n=1 Tax=Bilophila sp. TaxID=1929485 RepID=UPI0030779BFA
LMLFSLKFHRDNRQNALAVDPAKGKTGEKGSIFHRTVEMKQPQTLTEPLEKGSLPLPKPHPFPPKTFGWWGGCAAGVPPFP